MGNDDLDEEEDEHHDDDFDEGDIEDELSESLNATDVFNTGRHLLQRRYWRNSKPFENGFDISLKEAKRQKEKQWWER